MLKRSEVKTIQERAAKMFDAAGIVLTPEERANIEVVDEGLGDVYNTGLEIVTYINTSRVCAKEMVLFPKQTCPQHAHPVVGSYIGKEETFRCRWGLVYLYVPGDETPNPKAVPPKGSEQYYTVHHEIVLHPGEQYTIKPNTWHWFQSGEDGAIISEFSTPSMDETDIFTDNRIERITVIEED